MATLSGLVISVLAIGPNFRGFKPGRERWIFKGDTSPLNDLFRTGSKADDHK
jgi:hypothetical protein